MTTCYKTGNDSKNVPRTHKIAHVPIVLSACMKTLSSVKRLNVTIIVVTF